MEIRTAELSDLNAIARVEAECFPQAEAATREDFEKRLAAYRNHFWLLLDGERLVSFVDGMVTDQEDLTDDLYENAQKHDETGAWQMIFGVNTIPEYRSRGCAGELLARDFRCAAAGKTRAGADVQGPAAGVLRKVRLCQ